MLLNNELATVKCLCIESNQHACFCIAMQIRRSRLPSKIGRQDCHADNQQQQYGDEFSCKAKHRRNVSMNVALVNK